MGDEVTKDDGQIDMHRCYHEDRMSTPEEEKPGSPHCLIQIHLNLKDGHRQFP